MLCPKFTPPLRLERMHYVIRDRFDLILITNKITHLLSLSHNYSGVFLIVSRRG